MRTKMSAFLILFTLLLAAQIPARADESTPADPNGIANDPNGMIDRDGRVTLNFQDALVEDILDYLSESVGMVIVADTFPEKRITLISKQPLTIDEVVALMNTIMKEQGYAAVRMDRTLKMVPLEDAKQLNLPVTTGNDPGQIVAGDNLVTHIIPIRYANAARLREDISALLPSYAVISSNEASNSLIITDTTANIKRLIQIVKAVDTQMAAVADVRVFRLMYADAQNTARLINDVFEQQSTQSSRTGEMNPFMRMMEFGRGRDSGRGRDGGSQTEQPGAANNMRVIASADTQTNAVVVSGPSDVLDVIAKVVTDLDTNPKDERSLFVYKVKNAQAVNLKEKLNTLFQELQQFNEKGAPGGRSGNFNVRIGATGAGNTDISEEVYIEADEDTNSLLIMTSSKNYEKIKKIIDELDTPVPQVLIKVLLAEITTSNTVDLGVEFTVLNLQSDGDSSLFETTFPAVTPTPSLGGFETKIVQGDLTATLAALQKLGRLNVLSRPYILTSNNQTATITVGQEVPFIRDTRVTETGQTINTIEYEDIGIILEVTPTINDDGMVIMDVKPEISTTTADTVPISETVSAAVFAKRSSQSRVAVLDGQTIVIGGLMQDTEVKAVKQVPLVGDIPLLGALFKRTVTEKEKTELLIFLTPQVAGNLKDLQGISEHERTNSDVLQDPYGDALKKHVEKQESVYSK
ncbi:MAG: type II secretion system secretin GspD [Planctomycetales bacterium]|nr:type II secretion system secretin GspD [Planctomycetales bacterium]